MNQSMILMVLQLTCWISYNKHHTNKTGLVGLPFIRLSIISSSELARLKICPIQWCCLCWMVSLFGHYRVPFTYR